MSLRQQHDKACCLAIARNIALAASYSENLRECTDSMVPTSVQEHRFRVRGADKVPNGKADIKLCTGKHIPCGRRLSLEMKSKARYYRPIISMLEQKGERGVVRFH